jgi:error-prone DNA polymerase
MTASEHVVQDYASTSLSLKAHPVSFVREKLKSLNVLSTNGLELIGNTRMVKVAGLVLVRQRPGTAGGVCFITIEDETGYANLVVFESLFEKYRKEILRSRLLMVEGKLQREGDVTHVIVQKCYDLSVLLRKLTSTDENPAVLTLSRADEKDEYVSQAINKRTQVQERSANRDFPNGSEFQVVMASLAVVNQSVPLSGKYHAGIARCCYLFWVHILSKKLC